MVFSLAQLIFAKFRNVPDRSHWHAVARLCRHTFQGAFVFLCDLSDAPSKAKDFVRDLCLKF